MIIVKRLNNLLIVSTEINNNSELIIFNFYRIECIKNFKNHTILLYI